MIEVKGERGREEDEWKWKGFVDEQAWNWEWEYDEKEKEKSEGIVESEESFGIGNPTRNWQALNIASSSLDESNRDKKDKTT